MTLRAAVLPWGPAYGGAVEIPVQAGGTRYTWTIQAGPIGPVRAAAFSPDGKTLATAGHREVVYWDTVSGRMAGRMALDGWSAFALTYLADGRLVIGGGLPGRTGWVAVCSAGGKSIQKRLGRTKEGPQDVVYAVAVSSDGKWLATGAADGRVYVWNVADGTLARTITEHGQPVYCAAFSPDGSMLVTGGADQAAYVWEVGTWNLIRRLPQDGAVRAVAFSADSLRVALGVEGAGGNVVTAYQKGTNRQIARMSTGGGIPMAMVWTARPSRLYVAGSDGAVRVYDANRRRLLATWQGRGEWLYGLALRADGTQAAGAYADGTVGLWDAKAGRLLATLVQPKAQADEWAIVTGRGYVAAAREGLLKCRTGDGKAVAGDRASKWIDPEAVSKLLSGQTVQQPARKPATPRRTQPQKRPASGTRRRTGNASRSRAGTQVTTKPVAGSTKTPTRTKRNS